MEEKQKCDKLRFMQRDFCKNNENTNLCKELEKSIREEKCPQCEVVKNNSYNGKNYPQIGCGIGVFVLKD